MRERARNKGRLQNIIDYSNNVTMLIEGYSFDDFMADKRTYYSVMKNVEIVGEAAYMLSKDFKNEHPMTPWKIVQGMRHVLVHDYANIDIKELYNTAVNDIPLLKQQAEKYLADTDWDKWTSQNKAFNEKDDSKDDSAVDIIKIAYKMKVKGYSIKEIADITGLSFNEIESLK